MRVFVVKYDTTEPYDPGTIAILGVYTSRQGAEARIAFAKTEKDMRKCVDWDASNAAGLRFPNVLYKDWPVLLYSDRDDYYEILEMELDETPVKANELRSGGATECAPIAGHPSL